MKITPQISLIVAALQPDLGIGAKGKLPWRLKQEIKYFKDVTSKSKEGAINAVVMGRKTWESIPAKFRPLPNRINVVLSRSYGNTVKDGVLYYNTLESLMSKLKEANFKRGDTEIDKIFIIGGAQVYNTMLNDDRVDNLLITNIEFLGDDKPEIDTFLNWDLSNWERKGVDHLKAFVAVPFTEGKIVEGPYQYEYTMWERKT